MTVAEQVESGTVNVYVPAGNAGVYNIAPRSAIVGTPQADGKVLVDYEGNLYHADNLRSYGGRLLSAFWRHVRQYPTVARALVDASDLQLVGTYSWLTLHEPGTFTQTFEQIAILMGYLGVSVSEISAGLHPIRHHEDRPARRSRRRRG